MKLFLHRAWIVCLCVAFLALVGALVAGMRFGMPDFYYRDTLWQLLAILGVTASVFGALLAPGWTWPARGRLLLAGGSLSVGAGWVMGLVLTPGAATFEILVTFCTWGVLLGVWLGWLYGTPWHGLAAGVFLLGSVAALGLYTEHPDPAALGGLTAGLLAATLLFRSEARSRFLAVVRPLTFLLYLVVVGTLAALTPRHWSATAQYDLSRDPAYVARPQVCVSPDGQRAVTADFRGGAYLWNLKDGQMLWRRPMSDPYGVVVVRYPADDKAYCLFLNRDGLLTRWEAHTDQRSSSYLDGLPRPYTRPPNRLCPFLLALSPDGQRAAVVDVREERRLWIVELDSGRPKHFAVPTAVPVTALAWIGRDRILLGCAGSGTVHEVRVGTERLDAQRSFNAPLDDYSQLMVSPDRQRFCVFNLRQSPPLLIRFEDGAESRVGPPSARSKVVRFSKFGGAYLYWVGSRDDVHVWDVGAAREVRCYRQHRSFVAKWLALTQRDIAGLAISPEEKGAVSASEYGKVRVWELDHE